MFLLGLLCVIVVPFFAGIAVNRIVRERNADVFSIYASGLLSLFVVFLAAILVVLKVDADLYFLEKIFYILSLLLTIPGVTLFLSDVCRKRLKRVNVEISQFFFCIPAILLALYAYLWLAPSYVNDDTWEVVETTITTGTIYQYSAMTGKEMLAGLPIFNKVYILPMLYSCLCDTFGIPMRILGGLLAPLIVYIINLSFVYKIGKEHGVKSINWYMILYEQLLICGTYLPENGIPVTAGYAILREGYSGYAFAYGIVLPMIVYLCVRKQFVRGIISLIPLAGLVRIDRIYFAICEPFDWYRQINESGKLLALLLIAVLVALVLMSIEKHKEKWLSIITPEVFISIQSERLLAFIKNRRSHIVFSAGVAMVAYAAVSFMPFADGVELQEELSFEKEVEKTIKDYNAYYKTIWASDEFMATVRRMDGTVYTLYGRDDINNMMSGLDYEPDGGHSWDFYYSYLNMHVVNPLFYPSELTVDEAILEAKAEGMDIYIE